MRQEGYYPQERQYRGFELEEACLGHKIDWESILEKNKISKENLTRKQWEKIVQELYPEDPTLPKKKWGKDLYNFVADNLGLDIENPEGLYFYNSLGTGLDKAGIDCFFVFKNQKTEKEALLTIDLTTNPKKEEWKADLVIGETPDHRSNPEEYVQEIERIAEKIAEKLRDKTELVH